MLGGFSPQMIAQVMQRMKQRGGAENPQAAPAPAQMPAQGRPQIQPRAGFGGQMFAPGMQRPAPPPGQMAQQGIAPAGPMMPAQSAQPMQNMMMNRKGF